MDADTIPFSDPAAWGIQATGAYALSHTLTRSHDYTAARSKGLRHSFAGAQSSNHTIAGTQDARTRGCRGMIKPSSANKNQPTDKGAQQQLNYVIAVGPQQPHIRLLPIFLNSTGSSSAGIRNRPSVQHAHSTARIRTAQKHRLLITFNKLFQNL